MLKIAVGLKPPGRTPLDLVTRFDFDKIGADWQRNNWRIIAEIIREEKVFRKRVKGGLHRG